MYACTCVCVCVCGLQSAGQNMICVVLAVHGGCLGYPVAATSVHEKKTAGERVCVYMCVCVGVCMFIR